MTKTTTAGWYRELVAGHAVVSVKEALAVAPGLAGGGSIVALRDNGVDVYGERAGRTRRWPRADALGP